MASPLDIAIVGVAGCYAGARDVRRFWQNVLNKVDAVAPADAQWTGPYLDPASGRNDRIYTNLGGFLGELAEFDPTEFGIMPRAVDGGEPDHYLALKLARDALRDAGYQGEGARSFDPESAGVILGRGTYVNRGSSTLMQHGMGVDQTIDAVRMVRPDLSTDELDKLRDAIKAQLPAFNAEMSPGLVPNVAAGLIANRLNLMGPNFIIDAACASSLVAVELAVRELMSGRCNLVLTGGVQANTPPQLYMVFCQIGALARNGKLRPFDKNSGGTLLGEGAGMMVLKRREDAERDGDRIYAVIRGIGTSSDGRAKGLLAPRLEGEMLALKRAYGSAGIDPATAGLVEAHGTGIALGDQTEVQALTEVFGERRGAVPHIALGSVKSMISHCLPAAGSASMIKTALALHHKVLPPTLCDEVNPDLGIERTPFYINNQTRPWIHGASHPRRAGVNAFGFGGVNAHMILEEYRPAKPAASVAVQWHAPPQGELFLLAADSGEALAARVEQISVRVEKDADESLLGSLARALAQTAQGDYRLAVVAEDRATLLKRLADALKRLRKGEASFQTRSGLFAGHGDAPGKLIFMFPGEGAQYAGMLSDLAVAFPMVRQWFDFLDGTFGADRDFRPSAAIFPAPTSISDAERSKLEARLFDMDLASESLFSASQALFDLVSSTGLKPDAMLGHSNGENTALVAAGIVRTGGPEGLARTAKALNQVYQKLQDEGRIAEGKLLTVGAARAGLREQVLAEFGERLIVAMDNCPNQFVLFGNESDIHAAHEKLTAAGAVCAELPFGRAYHTKLFEPVARAFREFYEHVEFGKGSVPVYSCASMGRFPDEASGARDLTCSQWARPVRFRETLDQLYADGYRVFVEIGPSANLTSFVSDSLRERKDIVAVSTNSRRQPDLKHFMGALAQLWCAGVKLDASKLYEHRDLLAYDLDAAPPPAKLKPRLTLQIPVMAVKPDAVPPAPVAAPATVIAEPVAAPVAQAMVNADPRAAALKLHFELMQEFLDSQMRVLNSLSQPVAVAAPAVVTNDRAAFPLLGTLIEQTPTRRVFLREYNLQDDPFLKDHVIGGMPTPRDANLLALPVMPFTFSMEILAEAAAQLAGPNRHFQGLENLRGHRWLALDDGRLRTRIEVETIAPDRVQGRIYLLEAESAGAVPALVFEGLALFGAAPLAAPASIDWTGDAGQGPRHNPDGELYSNGMFHGPRLQGVERIRRWSPGMIEAELRVIPTQDYFGFTQTPAFQADAALLDAAGQVAAYWLTELRDWGYNCFPFRVARYTQFAPPPAAGGKVLCRGRLSVNEGDFLEAALDLIDEQGRLLGRIEGWEDRCFKVPPQMREYRRDNARNSLSKPWLEARTGNNLVRRLEAFPEHYLDEGWGIWKRVLAHIVLNRAERERFYALPSQGPRRGDWLMGRVAAKEAARAWIQREYGLLLANADIEIVDDARGKPSVLVPALAGRPAPSISLAHSQQWAAAVAGAANLSLGLDYQRLDRLNVDDLIAGAMTEAEARLLSGAASHEKRRLAAAIWCAKEAAAKALGTGLEGRPRDWEVTVLQADRRSESAAQARVRRQGQVLDVSLHFDSEEEVAALCQLNASTQRASA